MNYPELLRQKGRGANPFFGLMGIDPVSFGDGEASLAMDVRPEMMNGAGWLQGGVYAALMDETMALAVSTALDDNLGIATISASVDYYKGVQTGRLVAKGNVVRQGRKVVFAEAVCFIESEPEKILARMTGSFLIVELQQAYLKN